VSKFKDDWWRNAVWAVRNYPSRKAEYEELHRQQVTQAIGSSPGTGGINRTTENIALKQMPPMKQQEYDAVARAIQITRLLPDGDSRLALIERMYWQGKKLNIYQVIYQVGISEATGKRWHNRFIRTVGECLGYIS
jgi:hypothetical protein